MVNLAVNVASWLGFLDVVLALFYLGASIALPVVRRRNLDTVGIVLYMIQAIVAPSSLLVAGLILIVQGWRLDPILQFAFLLLNLLIIYLAIKDMLINRRR